MWKERGKEKAGKPEGRKIRRREDKDDEWISREMIVNELPGLEVII